MKRRISGFSLSLVVLVGCIGSLVFFDRFGQVQKAQALNGTTMGGDREISRSRMVSDHFSLYWDVLANGGSTMVSDHFRLSSTAGQPITGNSGSLHFSLRAGYWQNFFYHVFLPLVLRN